MARSHPAGLGYRGIADTNRGVNVVTDELCRVSVQAAQGDRQVAVDLALPARTEVALLLPSIVDIVHDDGLWPADAAAHGWRLSRVGGPSLDGSMTLRESAVRDGELLLLSTTNIPAPEPVLTDLAEAVADASPHGDREQTARIIGAAACLWAVGVGALTLLRAGIVSGGVGNAVMAAVMASAAAVIAVVLRRTHPDPLPCLVLAISAVEFTAVGGFLAVPAGPSAANLCLAAAAAMTASIVLLRTTDCGTACLTALASMSTLTATVSACGVAWTMSARVAGALLTTAALATLSVAARLSILLSRASPAMPTADGGMEEEPTTVEPEETLRGHRMLTGLVVGSSAASVAGVGLVAWCGHHDGPWLIGAAFAAVVGAVLMLRARLYVGVDRVLALVSCGILCVTVAFVILAVSVPRQASWAGVVSVIVGLGALCVAFGAPVSPVSRRGVELLEYLAVAAVVPLACWVVDLYGAVRALSLP